MAGAHRAHMLVSASIIAVRGPAEGRLLKRAEVMPVAPHPRIRGWVGTQEQPLRRLAVTQEETQARGSGGQQMRDASPG